MIRYNLLGSIIYIPYGVTVLKGLVINKKQDEASPSERCLLNKLDLRLRLQNDYKI